MIARSTVTLLLAVGCISCSPGDSPQKLAAQRATEAVLHNIPEGTSVHFSNLRVIDRRWGAVCGDMIVGDNRSRTERFWVGGTEVPDKAMADLERWADSKAEADAKFGKWCDGMIPINASLYKPEQTGLQTKAEQKKAKEEEAKLDRLFSKPLSEFDKIKQAQEHRKIVEKFNANIRAYNKRLREAYERGVKACKNMEDAGYSAGNGCPRPKPKYEKYMD